MSEFNSSSFLIELDSFGKPPPPQRITADTTSKDIAHKLDMINMQKQKKLRSDLMTPASNGMVKLGSGTSLPRQQISAEDTKKWRNDVLSLSRPRAQAGSHAETVDSARSYARQLARDPQLHYNTYSDSEDDRGTRSSSASNSLPSPPGAVLSPHLKVRTDHHERKSSDYSSASSQKSPSPPSQASYSDYASMYKSQTSSPATVSPRSDTNSRPPNSAFRSSGSVPVVTVHTDSRFSPVRRDDSKLSERLLEFSKSPSPSEMANGNRSRLPGYGYGSSLKQQVQLTDKPPSGRAPSFRPVQNKNTAKWRDISDTLDSQDRKFEELTKQLHKDLVMERKREVGLCAHCNKSMFDTEDRYTVQEKTYHARCFTCDVCGKELREQQFYLSNNRFFCKQDYLNETTLEKKETLCASCKEPIRDMVLSALNRNYHPRCFRCVDCGCCLDGIPFSLDKNNQVYCLADYHNRFAPRCTTCKQPIVPDESSGETVRIVALDNSYHIDCYVCEGCGLALTEEPDARCYPLGKHLLCHKCHIHWSKSDAAAPITDL